MCEWQGQQLAHCNKKTPDNYLNIQGFFGNVFFEGEVGVQGECK